MASHLPPLPYPSKLPERIEFNESSGPLWRIEFLGGRGIPSGSPRPSYRFDSPTRAYEVLYASDDYYAPYAEVFGDLRLVTRNQLSRRRLVEMAPRRPLRLVSLDDAQTQKVLGIDARICTDGRYQLTQAWSQAIHDAYEAADGIRYISRSEERRVGKECRL